MKDPVDKPKQKFTEIIEISTKNPWKIANIVFSVILLLFAIAILISAAVLLAYVYKVGISNPLIYGLSCAPPIGVLLVTVLGLCAAGLNNKKCAIAYEVFLALIFCLVVAALIVFFVETEETLLADPVVLGGIVCCGVIGVLVVCTCVFNFKWIRSPDFEVDTSA